MGNAILTNSLWLKLSPWESRVWRYCRPAGRPVGLPTTCLASATGPLSLAAPLRSRQLAASPRGRGPRCRRRP